MLASIVRVSTFSNASTGIMLPCNYEESSEFAFYLVMAPLHLMELDVLNNEELRNAVMRNTKDYLRVDISDANQCAIEYSVRDVFIGASKSKEDDVFALLIRVEKNRLMFNQKVSFATPLPHQKIETIGFPGIISAEIQDKLKLNGEIDFGSSSASSVMSYRITDNYHHYSDLKDHQILGGLSGAPVFLNGHTLIGMNQSIPYFSNEGNPFKIIYFITLKHIMDYLRESGCILYEHMYEHANEALKIKWIKNKDQAEENMRVLVIGGSGAGKSTFIKSFALHKDFIQSSGDGQTTRTEVEYNLKRYEENPTAEVSFLNKDNFCEKRLEDIWLDVISFIFINRYGFKELDLYEDRFIYMKEITNKLLMIKDRKSNDDIRETEIDTYINDILNITLPLLSGREEIDNKELFERYETILDKFSERHNPITCMKIFDNDFLEDLEFELIRKNGLKMNDYDVGVYGALNERIKNIIVTVAEEKNDEITTEKIRGEIKDEIVRRIFDCSYQKDEIKDSKNDKNNLYKQLEKILFEKKGFFSIDEFDFLFQHGDATSKKLREITFNQELEAGEFNKEEFPDIASFNEFIERITDSIVASDAAQKDHVASVKKIEDLIRNFFARIHYYVMKKLRQLGIKIFALETLTTETEELLSKCLKAVTVSLKDDAGKIMFRTDSLTAMVKKVLIKDSFSNDFAMLLDDLNINSLTFVDTHGLDHIEQGVSKKRLLRTFFGKQKEIREDILGKATKGIDAVFYLKKLDSGRPTELDYIIPLIYEVEPQVALFCIFTGIDIFNVGNSDFSDSWRSGDMAAPKAVQYLFSSNFKDALDKKLAFSKQKKEIIYRLIGEKVGGFCGTGDPRYREINKAGIRKILISTIIKEKNSVDIISEKLLNQLGNKESSDYKVIHTEVKSLLLLFFDKATITNWGDYHHMTAIYNALRTNREAAGPQLGLNRTSLHRWDYIFRISYDKIFSNTRYTKKLIQLVVGHSDKVESALTDLREHFLGTSVEIYTLDNTVDLEKKDSFKQLLVNLYDGESRNPFDVNSTIKLGKNVYNSRIYLNDVMNFNRLVRKEDKLDDFADLYICKLRELLMEDRKMSIRNVLKYGIGVRSGILSAYEELKRIFYATDRSNETITAIFEDIVDEVLKA